MFTITAQDRHGILHKGRIRKLMPIECWRLQGYSDEQFNKAAACGLKDGHLYKMAGNSVSVPVISAIGQRIKAVNEKYEIVRYRRCSCPYDWCRRCRQDSLLALSLY